MIKCATAIFFLALAACAQAATITWTQSGEANVANWTVRQTWDGRPTVESTAATKSVMVPTPPGKDLAVQIQANPSNPASYSVSAWGTATLSRTVPELPTNLRSVDLTVTATPIAASSTITLSTVGATDWVQWGRSAVGDINRRSGATTLIGALQPINAATPIRIATPAAWPALAWTGGTPTATEAGTHGAISFAYADAVAGSGFRVTAPAATAVRTLHLYVGAYLATGTVTATVGGASSSASAGDLAASTYYDVAIAYAGTGAVQVDWIKASTPTNGRISFFGAALE